MRSFAIESILRGDAETLADARLTMEGVNWELAPWVRMSAPQRWRELPIRDWPAQKGLFNSTVYLCGVLPIDSHRFGLEAVSACELREESNSLIMRRWRHQRTLVSHDAGGCRIRDAIQFEPRLRFMGPLLAVIYAAVFRHRHKRLRKRYG